MIRLRDSWLVALACCSAMPLGAQDTAAPDPMPSYATLMRANYRPLEAVRRGKEAMPSKLSRKVTLTRRGVLLQQALLDGCAGNGLDRLREPRGPSDGRQGAAPARRRHCWTGDRCKDGAGPRIDGRVAGGHAVADGYRQ